MKLREWDWDKQQYVEREYPDEIVAEFVNWIRESKAWWDGEEGLRMVHRRVQKLTERLAESRLVVAAAPKPQTPREVALKNLEKARAAKAAKRAAKVA